MVKRGGHRRCVLAGILVKVFNREIHSSEEARIQEELDKCDLVCANCHQEIHLEKLPFRA